MASDHISPKPKRLLVFCDGTWCGRETSVNNSKSNIQILAEKVGRIDYLPQPTHKEATVVHPITPLQPGIKAGYQEGVGLNKTFLEYLWDGATGSTIGEECTSVYEFIVRNYDDNTEIYLFGFSRGAFVVRCVAGMINNCGIIKAEDETLQQPLKDDEIKTFCDLVYKAYRSPLEIDKPHSKYWDKFKENKSRVWQEKRPVRLMVVADTVGGLGIPRVNAGVGFDWPEFYDQEVSTVVREVYHGLALHDRLWIFQPCFAYNGPGEKEVKIHQRWFPGCHYDVGRQTFRFLRQSPANKLERFLGAVPNMLSETIYPNNVLADVALRWMYEAIMNTEVSDQQARSIIPYIQDEITNLGASIRADDTSTGSGDVYDDILSYLPARSVFGLVKNHEPTVVEALNRLFPELGENIQEFLGIRVILRILTATKDRRIAPDVTDVYPYKELGTFQGDTFTVHSKAKMEYRNDRGTRRYPSRTFENFELWSRFFI